ncbi:hypothetical protein ACFXKJ_40880, partial [Kitasatospora indigofera]
MAVRRKQLALHLMARRAGPTMQGRRRRQSPGSAGCGPRQRGDSIIMSPDADNVVATVRSRLHHDATDPVARHALESLVDLTDALQGEVAALQAKVADLTQCLDEARHDPLTGLATRAAFTAAANTVIAAHPDALVVMLDADGLKQANDAY